MRLLPTARKQKLPAGFSYPLGAQEISAALGDLPLFGDAELRFRWRDEYWASRWRQRVQSRGFVRLLNVDYDKRTDRWTLRVYSVPSEYATAARERLRTELDRIRQQLAAAGARARSREFCASLNLATAGQAANQTHQATPGEYLGSNRTPSARRGCALRRANMHP